MEIRMCDICKMAVSKDELFTGGTFKRLEQGKWRDLDVCQPCAKKLMTKAEEMKKVAEAKCEKH